MKAINLRLEGIKLKTLFFSFFFRKLQTKVIVAKKHSDKKRLVCLIKKNRTYGIKIKNSINLNPKKMSSFKL